MRPNAGRPDLPMTYSLADSLLGPYKPLPVPLPQRGERSVEAPNAAPGEPLQVEPVEIAGSLETGSPHMAEILGQFREISASWEELRDAIQGLKSALEPEDLRVALTALGLDMSFLETPQAPVAGGPPALAATTDGDTPAGDRERLAGEALGPAGTRRAALQERLLELLQRVRAQLPTSVVPSAPRETPPAPRADGPARPTGSES